MSDRGWVIQEKDNPDGEWITLWQTAGVTREYSIHEWLDLETMGCWEDWEKWGRVRCVPCFVMFVGPNPIMINEETGGDDE